MNSSPKVYQKPIIYLRKRDANHFGHYFIGLKPKFEFKDLITFKRLTSQSTHPKSVPNPKSKLFVYLHILICSVVILIGVRINGPESRSIIEVCALARHYII